MVEIEGRDLEKIIEDLDEFEKDMSVATDEGLTEVGRLFNLKRKCVVLLARPRRTPLEQDTITTERKHQER